MQVRLLPGVLMTTLLIVATIVAYVVVAFAVGRALCAHWDAQDAVGAAKRQKLEAQVREKNERIKDLERELCV